MTLVPLLLLEDVLGALPGVEVGLWLTLILLALYSRKVLKAGSVAGQGVRYGAVAVGVIGLLLALGVLEGFDVAKFGAIVSGAVDVLVEGARVTIDTVLGFA